MIIQPRLLASVAAGILISAGVITMGAYPVISPATSLAESPFRIVGIEFGLTNFSTANCALNDGLIIVRVQGVVGDRKLASVTLDDQQINLDDIYVHKGETTTIVLHYPWLQGTSYQLKVSDTNGDQTQGNSPVSPVIQTSRLAVISLSIKGPSLRAIVKNLGPCNSQLGQVIVMGAHLTSPTNYFHTPTTLSTNQSVALIILLSFQPMARSPYNVTFVTQSSTYSFTTYAWPTGASGGQFFKPN